MKRQPKYIAKTIAPDLLKPGDRIFFAGCGVVDVVSVSLTESSVSVETKTQGVVSFNRSNWPQLAIDNPAYA